MFLQITNVEQTVFAYTSKGSIHGTTCFYNQGRDKYYSFDYVPYAHVPVGDLRFSDPKDIQTFDDLKLKGKDILNCAENCLYVSICTPEVRPDLRESYYTRPVIVFVPSTPISYQKLLQQKIFGGEFLISQDVVLVVLHYRRDILGFSGFRAFDKELGISGNAGFHDIIKGFEFVKEEIRHFGGCPGNITAYGHGSTCEYIRRLTIRPFAGKYFHKMILSSSMGHSLPLSMPQYDLRRVAEVLGGPDGKFDDDKACVEYLRKVPFDVLLQYSKPMCSERSERIVLKNNLLAVQGDIYAERMPVLIGFNSMEGLFERSIIPSEHIIDPEEYVGRLLWLTQTKSTIDKAAKNAAKIIEVYQDNLKAIGCSDDDIYLEMIETDIKYLVGIIHLVTNLAKEMHPENVYLYQFAANLSLKCRWNQDDNKYYPGTGHGGELPFIFNFPWAIKGDPEESARLTRQLTGIWARFAKTGNPNPAEEIVVDEWLPVGERLTHYYEIRSDDRSIYRRFTPLETIRFKLWEKVYGIEFFSAPIEKPERATAAADVEVLSETTSSDESSEEVSWVQTYKILPKAKPLGKVCAYTSKGSIEGDVCFYNNFYNSFQHVPYAQVPVGNLRFAGPKDISSFDDVKSMKLDKNGRYGAEDHLFLHIYTPEVRPQTSNRDYARPVIVFVPGRLTEEAEEYRSEDLYGPQFLLEEDVVLVVLSYRHDLLGFTAFDEPNAELDVPIDAGVQDIMLGFRFVKNEIRHFGGCPDNVTAYSRGTGAAHVRRIADKHAKDNLFHKMILSSSMEHAAGGGVPMFHYNIRYLVRTILSEDNFTEDKARVKFLRRIPIEELLKYDVQLFKLPKRYRFVRQQLLLSLATDISYETKMPVMIGYNSMEGLIEQMILANFHIASFSGEIHQFPSLVLSANELSNDHRANQLAAQRANKVANFYSHKTKGAKNTDIMNSDGCYNIGTVALATHFARTMAPENVYFYRFAVDLGCNFTKKLYGCKTFNEAAHADELGYIFKTPLTDNVQKDSFDDLAIKRMTKLWTQFARTGNPNPERRSHLLDVEWKPIGKKLTSCFHIDTRHVTYGKIPDAEVGRFRFWENHSGIGFFSGSLIRKNDDSEDNNCSIKEKRTRHCKKRGKRR